MGTHPYYRIAFAALLFSLSTSAYGKGDTVKLVVSGPDLLTPIEVSDPAAIHDNANVYVANFIAREQGPIENIPATPVPPYQVKFYVRYRPGDIRMKYVVYLAWDAPRRRVRVYFPGPSDPWWRHNAFTVLLPYEGAWYFANEAWGEAVFGAISAHSRPRDLEVAARHGAPR